MKQPINGEKSNMLPLYLSNNDKGNVKTVFRHSFNIKLPRILLHVGNAGDSLSCLGITLPDDVMVNIVDLVDVGDLVRLVHDKLYIYTKKEIVSIDLKPLSEVNLRIPVITPKPMVLEALSIILDQLPFETHWGLNGITSPQNIIETMLSSHSSGQIQSTITYLFGRGRGLTPSGDDILVGFLTVLQAFNIESRKLWEPELIDIMQNRATTDVSAAYLKATVAGFTSERVKNLLDCLSSGNMSQIEDYVLAIQKFGHTSGTDLLLGITAGVANLRGLSSRDKNG